MMETKAMNLMEVVDGVRDGKVGNWRDGVDRTKGSVIYRRWPQITSFHALLFLPLAP
jgi:hypothetical protein